MPSVAIQRKLDILSRSSSTTPKVLLDVIYLLVGELDRRENEHRNTENAIAELSLAAKDPSREIHQELKSLRHGMESLRRDAQQLEHAIREAEASFSAQYEVKRAEVENSIRELHCSSERLLREELPSSLSSQLQRVSAMTKEITSAALATAAASLKDLKHEVSLEVEEATKHHCTSALEQLQEECQVTVFASMRRVETEFEKIRAELEDVSARAVSEIRLRTSQCATFLGEKVASTLHAEPLLEVHRLMSEVQYCNAQVQFLRDASCTGMEAAAIRAKVAALEAAATALRVDQKRLVGFVSLWDADREVLEEMADMQPAGALHADTRIALMKSEYLRNLPALCDFVKVDDVRLSSHERTPLPPPISTRNSKAAASGCNTSTPVPVTDVARETLLHELSTRKSSGGKRQRHRGNVSEADGKPHLHEDRSGHQSFMHHHHEEDAILGVPSPLRPPHHPSSSDETPGPRNAANRHSESNSVASVFASLFPSPSDGVMGSHAEMNGDGGVVVEMLDSPPKLPREPQQLGLVVCDGDPLSGGVVVTRVLAESRMEKHGVGPNDQVLSVNGSMIADREHLGRLLQSIPSGAALRMHFFRPSTAKMFVVQTSR